MKYLIILVSVLLLISCNQKKESATAKTPMRTFEEFLKAIPEQPLPLEFTCTLPNGTKFTEDYKAFEEFMPKSRDRIFGSITSDNENYKLIIFGESGDDIYPILYSFDNQGKVKDSLFLILHGCGAADETKIPVSFVSISKDLTIKLTDTTRLIHYPKDKSGGAYVVDSMKVSKVVMGFSRDGRFVKQ